jgi:Protein of unknown function (DUF2911)
MKKFGFIALFISIFSLGVSAQLTLPRESQRQTITQTIGDTIVSIVYHRPNTKGRVIFGGLEPYGKVWRSGANENTVFEVSRDVTIEGKPLPAGKYGFHTIPGKDEWIVIFSKDNDKGGSFSYNQENDALRVTVKPQTVPSQETLSYDFSDVTPHTAKIVLRWEKIRVPFTVDVGDVTGRSLASIREAIKNRAADVVTPLNQGANYVFTFRIKENYDEALGWLDTSLAVRETFGTLVTRARLLAEMGKKVEAIAAGEKAIVFGKAAKPVANTADIEKFVAEWKAAK